MYTLGVMAGRFLVPVSRFRDPPICSRADGHVYDGVERFPANTLALPLAQTGSVCGRDELDVEVIQGLRYGYTRPRYRVSGSWSRGAVDVNPTRLELVPVGHRVLMQVPSKRIQMVQADDRGTYHIAQTYESGVTDSSRCGKSFKHNTRVLSGTPNCQECLSEGLSWVSFYVRPYTHPRDRKKVLTKAEKLQQEYDRRPSMFDKLIDDNYLDPNVPEPAKAVFLVDPETIDETEDFKGSTREEKLASAREARQRFKEGKEALKTELRAARRR